MVGPFLAFLSLFFLRFIAFLVAIIVLITDWSTILFSILFFCFWFLCFWFFCFWLLGRLFGFLRFLYNICFLPSSSATPRSLDNTLVHELGQFIHLVQHEGGCDKVGHHFLPKQRIIHVNICSSGGTVTCELALAYNHSLLVQPRRSLGSFHNSGSSTLCQDALNIIRAEFLAHIIVIFHKRVCSLLQKLFHFFIRRLVVIVVLPKRSQHGLFQSQLPTRSVKHFLFKGATRDQSINHHILRLSNPMTTRLCLNVILWIPIRVENNTDIRSR
mmetsp:Transcript_34062/g.52263  ORF Transcript_34062/g.52263 Transcript_34062/m.52263 type:complete len:272 (-) Transcript_34062:83-898(-)